MIFTKMQLNGNDFIYVNCLESAIKISKNIVYNICDRRFGIGADGLILVTLSEKADCKIEIYNSDGSKARICGNALLLLGKYLYELEDIRLNIKEKSVIKVETCSGIKQITLNLEYDEINFVTVNMGEVLFNKDNIITSLENVNCDIEYLSIGNNHGVIIVDDIDDFHVNNVNFEIQQAIKSKNELNVDFIQIVDESLIKIKTFERGVGETLSCGSGSCAAVAVAVKKGFAKRDVDLKVISKGGEHIVKYLTNGEITLTGKPKLVYNGYLRM